MAKTQQIDPLLQWELDFTPLLIMATRALMSGKDFQEYRQAEQLHIEEAATDKLKQSIILYDTLSRIFNYKVYPKGLFDTIQKFDDNDFVSDDIEAMFLNYIANTKSKELTSGFTKNIYHMVKPFVEIGIIGSHKYMISRMFRFVPNQAKTVETDKVILIAKL